MAIEIKHRWTGAVIRVVEADTLRDADLRGADLRDAGLSGADLRGADLRGADLRDAGLCGADLRGADLRGADLRGADLSGADLRGADLCGADLCGAGLCGADLCGVKYDEIPVVDDIRQAILIEVEKQPDSLAMDSWHGKSSCGTTHCLAGWAVHLAGEQGYAMEKELSTNTAGALIFFKSCGEIPNFYSTEETALEWLKGGSND